MRRPDGLALIARARRFLNAIIMLSGGFLLLAPVATVSGIVILVLEFSRLVERRPILLAAWAGLSLILFVVGAAFAARRRLDLEAAAAWLDAKLGTRELLSALLARLALPGESGRRFDRELFEKASDIASAARRPGFPLRVLARRGIAAGASCIAFAALIAGISPSAIGLAPAGSAGAGEVSRVLPLFARGQEPLSESSAKAVSRFLFPDDAGSADLAERALREGRAQDFRNLLRKATKDIDDRISRGVSDQEKKKLLQERRKLEDAAGAAEEPGSAGSDQFSGDQGSAGEASPPDSQAGSGSSGGGSDTGPTGRNNRPPRIDEGDASDSGGGKGGRRSDGNSQDKGGSKPPQSQDGNEGKGRAPGQGQGENLPDDLGSGAPGRSGSDGDSGGGASPGGQGGTPKAGSGSGSSKNWGSVLPQAKGDSMTIAPDRKSPFFDYVLPGKDPRQALPGLAGSAGRSSESAIARQDLPFEYEDFVKSYFLLLAQQSADTGDASKGVSR